jgi:hypothetical protein
MNNTVIVKGARPQTIIAIIANKFSFMFKLVLQLKPLLMSVSDCNVRARYPSIMNFKGEFQNKFF